MVDLPICCVLVLPFPHGELVLLHEIVDLLFVHVFACFTSRVVDDEVLILRADVEAHELREVIVLHRRGVDAQRLDTGSLGVD